ncbi:MAG: hypothetical protein ABW134_11835 [Candidatus Thiodiazotropha endolucinida]
MFKNTAGKWTVYAFGDPDHSTLAGKPVTGDAANITANIRIDGGAANAVDDTNPTELEDGYYVFDITAAETNGDLLTLAPASSTANVIVIGVPGAAWTRDPTVAMAANLTQIGGRALETGTCQSGSTTGCTLAAGATSDDITGAWIFFTGGTGAGQAALVESYNTGTKVVVFNRAVVTAPGATSEYIIIPHAYNTIADMFTKDTGETYASAVDGSVVKETADNAGGSSLTEAGIADAIWDEPRTGHNTAGTFGETQTTVEANIDNLDAPVSGVPTAAENRAEMDANSTQLATIAGYLDTEIASLQADVTAILADTNEMQGDQANGGRIDLLIDAIKAKTDQMTFTVANMVDANMQAINDVAVTGDGQTGTEFSV